MRSYSTQRNTIAGTAVLFGVGAILTLTGVAAVAQQHIGQYERADIEYGAQLFSERCIACHGERGDLMPQANLRNGQFRNATSDRELSRVISDGISGTAMVPTGYAASELTALVAYLRNMSSFDASGTSIGDAARGRVLFEGKGDCTSCHRFGSIGPLAAPDLSAIGALRTAATLQRTLIAPDEALLPLNRPVRAVTAGGTVISGRRLNEDTFTVQLVTDTGRLVALDKTTLREFDVGMESAHPAYGETFTEMEIADFVAYLLSLKGFDR